MRHDLYFYCIVKKHAPIRSFPIAYVKYWSHFCIVKVFYLERLKVNPTEIKQQYLPCQLREHENY